MGYTHYWYRPLELGASTFAIFADDCRKLAYASEIPIGDAFGGDRTAPHFGADGVIFNGIGDDAHETFHIPQVFDPPSWRTAGEEDGTHFDFCKTARKPYDVLVSACLIALKHHFGDLVTISSDGRWGGTTYSGTHWSEWEDGRYLYERVFPERAPVASVLREDEE